MSLRFGITMRQVDAVAYDEKRDAIARDWSYYMLNSFPEDNWMFIPNIKDEAINLVKNWKINVLIITGGDDIGKFPDRDKTEHKLLKYSLKNKIPVIAICRGMQLVHSFYGGTIKKGNYEFKKNHQRNRHYIKIKGLKYSVNSFHTGKIIEETINDNFKIIGRCDLDNSVECMKSKQILSMMWHPEREDVFRDWNKKLIKNFIYDEF